MEITEIRIKLMDESGDRLRAFCSITLDSAFVIRDLKIIEGPNGYFVAMPSRKLTTRCNQCGCKNHLKASYCNQCGVRITSQQSARDEDGRSKLYADVAHPINTACRELVQQRLLESFEEELRLSQLPNYVPSYSDYDAEGGNVDFGNSYSPKTKQASEVSSSPSVSETKQFDEKTYATEPGHSSTAKGPHQRPAHLPSTEHASQESSSEGFGEDGFGAGIL